MPEGGEKTEQASAKKREDERKKGNIFMSKDVTTIISLLIAFYSISFFIAAFLRGIQEFYILQIERIVILEVITEADLMDIAFKFMVFFAIRVLPPILLIMFSTIITVGAQTRFLFSREQIKFKLNRISPLKGIMRLFSLRSMVELLKSLIKIVILGWILYGNVRKSFDLLPSMLDWSIEQGIYYAGQEIMKLVLATGIAFGAVAALDYLYQRWEYEKSIRMTKQEVKDEYKQMEGNPEIKGARRQKQREFAQQRMMQQVKDADVVVRNPTHYAVAIKYDLGQDSAPTVLAKGQDLIALKIIEEAEKYGITAIENRPLARSLYELAEIGDFIPAELYQPVAELLAWLYSTREKAG